MKRFILKLKAPEKLHVGRYHDFNFYFYNLGEKYLKLFKKEFILFVEMKNSKGVLLAKRKVILEDETEVPSTEPIRLTIRFLVPRDVSELTCSYKLIRKIRQLSGVVEIYEFKAKKEIPTIDETNLVYEKKAKDSFEFPLLTFNDLKSVERKHGVAFQSNVIDGILHANADCKELFEMVSASGGRAENPNEKQWDFEKNAIDGLVIHNAIERGIGVDKLQNPDFWNMRWISKKIKNYDDQNIGFHKVRMLCIENVSLVAGPVGFCLFRDNLLLKETAAFPLFPPVSTADSKKFTKNAFWASGRTKHNNIYHAVLDDLSRAWLATMNDPSIKKLFFYNYDIPYCKEVIKLCFDDDKIEFVKPDAIINFKKLSLLDTSINGCASPAVGIDSRFIEFLRERCISDISTRKSKKIYVCRRDAKTRKLMNEQKLSAELGAIGFETIVMSDYSPRQQIDLFSSSAVIVAEHGAALANLAFCMPGTIVVELFSPHQASLAYAKIAYAMNFDYVPVVGSSSLSDKPGDTSWVVDVATVLDLVSD